MAFLKEILQVSNESHCLAARRARQVALQGRSWERSDLHPHPDPWFEVPRAETPERRQAAGTALLPGLCHLGLLSCSVPDLSRLRSPAPSGRGMERFWRLGPGHGQRQRLALALPALLPDLVLTVVLEDIPRKTRVRWIPRYAILKNLTLYTFPLWEPRTWLFQVTQRWG